MAAYTGFQGTARRRASIDAEPIRISQDLTLSLGDDSLGSPILFGGQPPALHVSITLVSGAKFWRRPAVQGLLAEAGAVFASRC
jgi:hypothetical protein